MVTSYSAVAQTTENNAQSVHRGPNATLKGLRVVVHTNTRGSNSPLTTRKNGADTAQTVTITASTTGTFTDLSDNVSLTAGDTYSYSVNPGGTSGSLIITSIGVNLESSGQAATQLSGITSSITVTGASINRWVALGGYMSVFATVEARAQNLIPVAGNVSNLRVFVTAARATSTTVRSRKNSANGSQIVTLTGGTTGAFEDTTNSDTMAAGDILGVQFTTGTGSDSLTVTNCSGVFTSSVARATVLATVNTAATLSAAVTRYSQPLGAMTFETTEALAECICPCPGTISAVGGTVDANSSTAAVSLTCRIGGVDTSVVCSIPASTTGGFYDTSATTAAVAAGNAVSVKYAGAVTGSLTFRTACLRFTGDVIGGTSTSNFLMFF